MTIIVNDNFTRANANPIGGIYSTLTGVSAIQLLSDVAEGTATAASNGCIDTSNTYTPDQWCSATVGGTWANGANVWLLIRMTQASSGVRITLGQGSTTATLNFYNGSSFNANTYIWNLNTPSTTGDNYLIWVNGQNYYLAQNGASCGNYFDAASTVTSGTVGFGFFTTGVLANSVLSLFQSGNATNSLAWIT